MGRSIVEFGAAVGEMPCHAGSDHDPVRRVFAVLPRPLRFLGVGGLGLITGAACGALVSYSGHALFAFRPRRPAPAGPGPQSPGLKAHP